jgi:hypothetical protein
LLDGLRRARGKGRNDHPISVLWAVVLLTIVLRHSTFEACLNDLRRNRDLRLLIGIEDESHVPDNWNVSRFLDTLGQEPRLSNLRAVFDFLVGRVRGKLLCPSGESRQALPAVRAAKCFTGHLAALLALFTVPLPIPKSGLLFAGDLPSRYPGPHERSHSYPGRN